MILRAYVGPEVQWILYGALMILIVYVLPEGIVPAIERWFAGASRGAIGAAPREAGREARDDRARPRRRRPILSIEHVAVHFGGLTAISDMTFDVARGELVSLIGPNGAGKTTAFNVVTGFLRPTPGRREVQGRCRSPG